MSPILVVSLAFLSLQPQKGPQGPQPQENAASGIRSSPQAPLVVQVAPSPGAAAQAGADSAAEVEHAHNEQLTARATVALAVLTFLLAGGTVGLAFYTFRLWRATQKLATEAEASANRTLKHLEVTAERQLRAYVSLRNFNVRRIGASWYVAPEFENAGATPANNVELVLNYEFREAELPADFDFGDRPSGQKPSLGSVGPRCRASAGYVDVPLKLASELVNGTKRGYVWGWAKYVDVFPDSPARYTYFAGEMEAVQTGPSITTIELRVAMLERHNEAT